VKAYDKFNEARQTPRSIRNPWLLK
jgi:hypothetical protein